MRAIVLAAGAGQRMRPLTDDRHKSLLEVDGTSILARIIEGLRGIEVTDVLVVTGYRHEEVEEFLKSRFGTMPIRCLHNARFRETNNIVSLAMALEHLELDQDLILIECDVLFEPALLRLLAGERRGNLALVDRYRPGMDGTVVSVSDGVVTEVYPPHLQGEDFDYRDKFKTVNIYRFDSEFCRATFRPLLSVYAHQIDGASYYELVLGMLIHMRRQPVRAVLVESSQWAEVDDPNDLASARYVFEPGQRSHILAETMGAYWNFDVLDFSFLRNMYFPTDAMFAAMRRALPGLVRNYGSAQTVLDQKLGYALACRADRLLCLNGGAQAFPWLQTAYADARVLRPHVTFNEYARWLPHGHTYADLPAEVGNFDLVVAVNPNNPTGTTIPTAQLHALAAANPDTQFLVDESFVDFSGQPSLLSRLEAAPLDNVLVLASLSKTWGIPGVRLGYLYSTNRSWLERFRSQVPIWNANSVAEFFLEMVLKFQPELAASFAYTAADRAALANDLAKVPIVAEVYPSGADFLLVRMNRPVAAVVEQLLQRHSILIKDVSSKFPPPAQYARVAVRTPADNQRLLAALSGL